MDFFKISRSMRSRSFSRCKRAISAAWSADGRRLRRGAPRRRRRLPPGPTLLYPPPQHGIAQAKFLGHRSDRAATRCDQIYCLPLVIARKRPTLTSFHPTPPGSSSLLQVSKVSFAGWPSVKPSRHALEMSEILTPLLTRPGWKFISSIPASRDCQSAKPDDSPQRGDELQPASR